MGVFGGEPMARHRSYSIEFKRQVAQVYLGGESLNGLARRHDVSRNLMRVWIAKYEAGAVDDEAAADDGGNESGAAAVAAGGSAVTPHDCGLSYNLVNRPK